MDVEFPTDFFRESREGVESGPVEAGAAEMQVVLIVGHEMGLAVRL